jgi:mRNA deadenylase 3'-5' endonuclease subunit Ccr4
MTTFRVVQYNLLGRSLSLTRYFPYASHYIQPGQAYLDWSRRSQTLKNTINNLAGDIYCLCEVDEPDTFQLSTHDSIYQQRPEPRLDGCMIMWNKSLFSFIQQNHIVFPTTERIALAVDLFHLPSQQPIRVIGTHLYWDATSPLQLQEAIHLKSFITNYPNSSSSAIPTILAGDFNNTRDSDTFRLLTSIPEKLVDVFSTNSSSSIMQESSQKRFTTLVPGIHGRKEEIDFLFLSTTDQVEVIGAGVWIETDEEGRMIIDESEGGIPDEYHGSDHFPVYADLLLK